MINNKDLTEDQYKKLVKYLKAFHDIELVYILLEINKVIVTLCKLDKSYIIAFFCIDDILKWQNACINWLYVEDIHQLNFKFFVNAIHGNGLNDRPFDYDSKETLEIYNNFINSNKITTIKLLQ